MGNYLIPAQGEAEALETAEARWIVTCLRAKWEPNALETLRSASADPDWAALIELGNHERVSAMLYKLARDKGLLPPDIQARLRQIYLHSLKRNAHLTHELERVLEQFAGEGVPVLLIKGAALAEPVYGDLAARPMADLDLLVPPANVELARAALESAGYKSSAFEPWPGFSQRYRHVLEYQRPYAGGYAYLVDLHWGPLDVPYYTFIPVEEWFDRAQEEKISKFEIRNSKFLPSFEDHFLCLCGHLGLHERYNAPLIRYYDLALLIQHGGGSFSWEAILQRGADWQLVIPLQRALSRLETLWPEVVPPSVALGAAALKPSPEERRIHALVVDRGQNPTSDVLFFFATTPGLARKTGYFLEQAFPSPAYMRQLYCPSRPYLWPLTYPLRAALTLRYLADSLTR